MPRKDHIKEYLEKIRKYYYKNWLIPNFQVLADLLGLKSKGSIHKIFNKLIEMWYIIKEWKKTFPTEKFLSVPMFESVKAWKPTDADDNNKIDMNIHRYLIWNPENTVMIKVNWDSMQDAGILDWDIVVVNNKNKKPLEWEIVVAIVDNEFTLKYYMKDISWKPYLRAANKNYNDIKPQNQLEIFGTVMWSFRKY